MVAEGVTEIIVRDGGQLKLRTRTIRIEVTTGPNAGQTVELAGPEVRIGTGRGVQLVLFDPAVSRHHLTLRIESRGVRVMDMSSSNGTLLDGVRIVDAYARPDSVITVGSTALRLRLSSGVVDLPLSSREKFGGLVGKSVAMRQLFTLLERVATAEEPVLIEGETGTGKELTAEAIHEESRRSDGPFVIFDCSAVTPSLIESELFGHVRGAFTGADADRGGAFEQADGGTLFLDEIGELPIELQPKLLRALENFKIRRVGSNEVTQVDVRIIAATNRNLAEEVGLRHFREDLFYRLAVIRVHLPPLRARADDLEMLIDHFVAHAGSGAVLPREAKASLAARAWPGNVRELRNAVMRTLSLGLEAPTANPGHVAARAIDLSVPFKDARDRVCDEFEKAYLSEALRAAGGNATKAADLVGINRKLMQRAIKKYNLRADLEEP